MIDNEVLFGDGGESMGIVVAVVMLMGLLVLRPTPWRADADPVLGINVIKAVAVLLVSVGCWNIVWYGLKHVGEFWGWIAIGSGIIMLLSAWIIYTENWSLPRHGALVHGGIRLVVIALLSACFLLYTVTIVQLNMGLAILGRG